MHFGFLVKKFGSLSIFDDLLSGFVMIYLDWFVLFRLHESLSFLGSLLGSPDFFGGSLSLLRSLLVSQECFFGGGCAFWVFSPRIWFTVDKIMWPVFF